MTENKFKYRICWSASSNITFRGTTGWQEWEENEDDAESIVEYLETGTPMGLPPGLEEALDGSGFSWWPEVEAL